MVDQDAAGDGDGLSPPQVPPAAYDEDYYRHACAGAAEWESSGGARYSGMYPATLARANFREGEVLVDLGTGRGELLAAAARLGAGRAIGIEYSPAAVELARKTLRSHQVDDRAEVFLADVRDIPVPDETADLVTMLDVVEHLAPQELTQGLHQAYRLLKPGGRLLIHTFPTRTVYDVTYRWQRALRPSRRTRWPENPRNEFELAMHVNEQTRGSLRRSLRSTGFAEVRVVFGDWVYTDFVPEQRPKRTYRWLAANPITRPLGAADLWGEGRRR